MHVAVLGAGYAGLGVTRKLEQSLPPEVDITLVNDGPNHVLTHEVHRAIRRPAVADAISIPLADVLDRAEIGSEPVEQFDAETGEVTLSSGETFTYDYGAVCFGSDTAYYGIDGLQDHAHPLKTLDDATAIRADALDTIDAGGDIVVGGAGLSGIQVAGELAALAREESDETTEDTIDETTEDTTEDTTATPDDVSITLLEQLDTVAPGFPEQFQQAVHDALDAAGVEIHTDTAVVEVDDETVVTDKRDVSYDTLVWTGGITGQRAANGDRPTVRADLKLTERTFALGDAARVVDANGEAVPASASAAIREAKTAATNITRLVEHEQSGDSFRPRLEQYRFDVPGWLVSVGDGAVAQIGPTVLTGKAAKAAKTTVGAGYLTTVGATRNAVELAEEELS
jgi:NADH dehydrogenase